MKKGLTVLAGLIVLGLGATRYSRYLDNSFNLTSTNTTSTTTGESSHTQPEIAYALPISKLNIYKQRVDIFTNNALNLSPPEWLKPYYSTDINYWTAQLPSESDRHQDSYLVIPSLGIVAPITHFASGSSDRTKALSGDMDVFFAYFLSGVNVHPFGKDLGMSGNVIIGGHSSYYKNIQSDYKTIFTVLPGLDPEDDIRGYVKGGTGRIMYSYKVTKSFQMKQFTPDLMHSDMSKRTMTLYTCVPIGTAKDRRIIQADYVSVRFFK